MNRRENSTVPYSVSVLNYKVVNKLMIYSHDHVVLRELRPIKKKNCQLNIIVMFSNISKNNSSRTSKLQEENIKHPQ